jgi:Cu(I)/Ag(I) efflux system membrane protein CusA/SilA
VDDVWNAVVKAAEIPGTTGAPFLQPIAARLVMLQSGMRAPMGVKIQGPDLETIQDFGYAVEELLKEVPGVRSETVLADRIVGKPYLEIHIDREAIAHYGIHLGAVQSTIEVAIGGKPITRTVEGRERYPVRVRYLRELRDSPDDLGRVLVSAPDGSRIPLSQLADIRYTRGPQVIKSEDTFLTGNVIFDKTAGEAEVDVVERARAYLDDAVAEGRLAVPAGVSWRFAGTYENQLHARKTLQVILPVALLVVMLILYFQFRSWSTTALVFSGIAVAWAGGFVLLWAYGRPEFLWLPGLGDGLRDLFQVGPMNLSVAVWVGFLALFGVATDNGVILGADLERTFREKAPKTREELRAVVREAGIRRVRPCLMTTATTILALLPVLTSTGKGADIMVPMAVPSFGGMIFVLGTTLLVPVLYGMLAGRRIAREEADGA